MAYVAIVPSLWLAGVVILILSRLPHRRAR